MSAVDINSYHTHETFILLQKKHISVNSISSYTIAVENIKLLYAPYSHLKAALEIFIYYKYC